MEPASIIALMSGGVSLIRDGLKILNEKKPDATKMKLLLGELLDKNNEVKLQLSGLIDTLREKNERIRELNDKLSARDKVELIHGVYWQRGLTEFSSNPFCPTCWPKDGKLIPMHREDHGVGINEFWSSAWSWDCGSCKLRVRIPDGVQRALNLPKH